MQVDTKKYNKFSSLSCTENQHCGLKLYLQHQMITYFYKICNTNKGFLCLILIFISILNIHKSTNRVYLSGFFFLIFFFLLLMAFRKLTLT